LEKNPGQYFLKTRMNFRRSHEALGPGVHEIHRDHGTVNAMSARNVDPTGLSDVAFPERNTDGKMI